MHAGPLHKGTITERILGRGDCQRGVILNTLFQKKQKKQRQEKKKRRKGRRRRRTEKEKEENIWRWKIFGHGKGGKYL